MCELKENQFIKFILLYILLYYNSILICNYIMEEEKKSELLENDKKEEHKEVQKEENGNNEVKTEIISDEEKKEVTKIEETVKLPKNEEHKEGLLNNKQPKEIIDNNNKSNENNVDISKSNSEIQNEASIQNVKVDNNTNKINQIISNNENKIDISTYLKQITQFIPDSNSNEEEGSNIIYNDKRELQYMSLNLIVAKILSVQNEKYNNIDINQFIKYFVYQKQALLSIDVFLDIINFIYDSDNKEAAIALLNQYITNHFLNEIQNDQALTDRLIKIYSKIPSESEIKFYNITTSPQKIISLLKDSDKLKTYYTLLDMSGQNILIYREPSPDTIVPQIIGNNFDIFNWSAVEIARQMSLMTHQLFQSIEPKELLSCLSKKQNKEQTSPHVTKIITRFNSISFWICEEILSYDHAHTRSKVIEKFISIADELQKVKNYNDCFNVITPFNYLPIKRLIKTWNRVSTDSLLTLKRLSELCSLTNNFENLRKEYNSYKSIDDSKKDTGCIPYLGYFLKELICIEEEKKYFNDKDLINVDKVIKIGQIIEEIKYFQRFGYNYEPCFSLSFLSQPTPLDEEQLLNLSKKIEPKFTLTKSKTNNKRITKTDEEMSKADKACNSIFNEYIEQMNKVNSIFLTKEELNAIKKK